MSLQGNSGPYLLYTYARTRSVLEEAGKQYAPNQICNYLYDLAQKYNSFYNKHRIINGTMKQLTNETMNFRLALTAATGQILKNGLNLLGIEVVERM